VDAEHRRGTVRPLVTPEIVTATVQGVLVQIYPTLGSALTVGTPPARAETASWQRNFVKVGGSSKSRPDDEAISGGRLAAV
jgi:hypothetical protein